MAKEKKRMLPQYKVVELKADSYVEEVETYTDANGNRQSRTIVTWKEGNQFFAASGKVVEIQGQKLLRVTEWIEA